MNKIETRVKEQFKGYLFLSVFYAILMVTAQAMAYRLIELGTFLEPGGIFIFPMSFAVSDIIAEVYGPSLARRSIFAALFAQGFYSFVPMLVNILPHPAAWHHADAYQLVFGSSWLVFVSNLIAVMVGMILNTQIIGKTKIKTQGKYFCLRSLFASAIGEFILTAIIVCIALIPVEGIYIGMKLFLNMFLFKLVFSFLATYPASFFVKIFKKLDNCDVYEEHVSLNPISQYTSFMYSKKAETNPTNSINFVNSVQTNNRCSSRY